MSALTDNERLIFTATTHAQRAADYLHSLQPGQDGTDRSTAAERVAAGTCARVQLCTVARVPPALPPHVPRLVSQARSLSVREREKMRIRETRNSLNTAFLKQRIM